MYEYQQYRNSMKVTRNLKNVFGEDLVTEFAGEDLKNPKFQISNVSRSEIPSVVNKAMAIKIIEPKHFSITADIAEILK